MGKRKQIEAGLTPEEELIYTLIYLEEKDQVINNYQGKGKASDCLGAYFKDGIVPCLAWGRSNRQAFLGRNVPANSDSASGCRAAVRV